jgi:hypothetical protein
MLEHVGIVVQDHTLAAVQAGLGVAAVVAAACEWRRAARVFGVCGRVVAAVARSGLLG